MHNKVICSTPTLLRIFFFKKTFSFFSPLLHNGIQISYSLSFSSLDTPIPPQCPYMSPFLSKSPTAKFNAISAGGMQLTAVDVCSPIARLLLNYYYYYDIIARLTFDKMYLSSSSILRSIERSFWNVLFILSRSPRA